jgi:hypothetical protein
LIENNPVQLSRCDNAPPPIQRAPSGSEHDLAGPTVVMRGRGGGFIPPQLISIKATGGRAREKGSGIMGQVMHSHLNRQKNGATVARGPNARES